jgi:hypothetical protein
MQPQKLSYHIKRVRKRTAENKPRGKNWLLVWEVALILRRLRMSIKRIRSSSTNVKRAGVAKMKAWYSFSWGAGVEQHPAAAFPICDDIPSLPALPHSLCTPFCNRLSCSLCAFTQRTFSSLHLAISEQVEARSWYELGLWGSYLYVLREFQDSFSLSLCNVLHQVLVLLISLHSASCKTLSLRQMQTFLNPSKLVNRRDAASENTEAEAENRNVNPERIIQSSAIKQTIADQSSLLLSAIPNQWQQLQPGANQGDPTLIQTCK